MSGLLPAALTRYRLLCLLIVFLVAVLACAWAFQPKYEFAQSLYIPLHTAMHVFALVVAWLVFAVGWNTHNPERAGGVTLLACGFLGVALLDFGHALSYAGMPDFITPASPEKAINFSLGGRLLAALALLALAFFPRLRLEYPGARYAYLASLLTGVALVYWVILFHPRLFPSTYTAGSGLTAFKVGFEYGLAALHVLAAVGFYRQLATTYSQNAAYLCAASLVMALSQVLLTMYAHPYDLYNFLSHVYRVIAYVLIYRGVFISEIREPYNVAERLQGELRESATRLREMSARMQQDIEEERKRISQSLHDEMGQNLTGLQLDADWIRRHCNEDPVILSTVDRMQGSIEESAASMRRIVADLRPRILDDLGIAVAIKALVKHTSARSGLKIVFSARGEFTDIEEATQTALYRMLQECLTNVIRHAQATQVQVALIMASNKVEMTVADNGRGFSPQERLKRESFGLFGLAERAAQLFGTVTVQSAPEKGTRVVVELPLRAVIDSSREEAYARA